MILSSVLSISGILINFFYVVIVEKVGFKSEDVMFIIIGYSIIELIIPKIISLFGEKKLNKNIFLFSFITSVLFLMIALINSVLVFIPMLILPMITSILGFYIDKSENLYVDTIKAERRATILSIFSMGANGVDVGFLFLSSKIVSSSFFNLFIFISMVFFSIGIYFLFNSYKSKSC